MADVFSMSKSNLVPTRESFGSPGIEIDISANILMSEAVVQKLT